MTLIDLIAEIGQRHKLSPESPEIKALLSDLKAAGCKDGPNLQAAFDSWRTSWKYDKAPKAVHIAEHYVQPTLNKPVSRPESGERQLTLEEARERLERENQAFSAAMREQMGVDRYDGMVMECMRRFMAGEKVSGILRGPQ